MSREILTFNYPEAKGVVICGDIHGAFEEMVFKLCIQYGMTDTLLIVAGDCGFGFEKPGYVIAAGDDWRGEGCDTRIRPCRKAP